MSAPAGCVEVWKMYVDREVGYPIIASPFCHATLLHVACYCKSSTPAKLLLC